MSGEAARSGSELPASAPAAGAPADGNAVEPTATFVSTAAVATPKMVIYTGQVDLVAEDLTPVEAGLPKLVKARRGYIAKAETGGTPGQPRTAQWEVRIPSAGFHAFLAEVATLGELRRRHEDSEDVGEEYFDLEARLRNKKVEEARLIQHLQRSTARLRDILDVERELSRVRGEIEQMEGRRRYLATQVALSTVTITVNEVKEFTPAGGTSFSAQIGRTFGGSLAAMRDTGQAIVLLLVAVAPWMLLLLLLGVPVWLAVRRRLRPAREGEAAT